MATVSEQIQQIYIGLLGRAAAQAGLEYWTEQIESGNLTIEQLRANIVNEQPEYIEGLGSQTRAQVVFALYENLFERAPADEGLEYWVNGGGSTVNIDQLVLALIDGASAADQLVLANKVEAAEYYTAQRGSAETHNAGDAAAAVAEVDGTVASLEASKAVVDGLNNPGNTSNTFTLQENTTVIGASAGQDEVTELVNYWGDPDTGEGIPLVDLLEYVRSLTGLDFHELGLINIANGNDDGLNNGEEGSPGSSTEVNGGIDPNDAQNITITTGDVGDDSNVDVVISVTDSDGTIHQSEASIAVEYVDFLNDLLLDGEDGESRLFEKEIIVSEGVSGSAGEEVPVDIVLTTTTNNGGTVEAGYTSAVNDKIDAGRLDLLHKAYIDGGDGVNTLQISAKGVYAQPKQLFNIDHVTIENLPNVYTTIDDDGQPVNTYTDYGWGVSGTGEFANSVLDLRYAHDIQTLTITEGDFEGLEVYDLEGGIAQQSVVNFGTSVVAGDVFVITINGVDVSYEAQPAGADPVADPADTIEDVIAELVAAINNDPTVGDMVTASAGQNNINLTGDVAGADFNLSVDGDINDELVVEAEEPSSVANSIPLGDLTISGVRNGATTILEGNFSRDVKVHYSDVQGDDGINITLDSVNFTSGSDLDIAHNSPTLNIESTGGGNTLKGELSDSGEAGLQNLNITGDAFLYIQDSIASDFAGGTPAHIDASANTAGVDLSMNGYNDEVHFVGTLDSDDHFSSVNSSSGRDVSIQGGHGNNEFSVETDGNVVVSAGEGNNEIWAISNGDDEHVLEENVTVTVLGGNNHIGVESTDKFTISAGDGDNLIEAQGGAFEGVAATETDVSAIVLGDGNNQIDADAGVLAIVAGDGSNQISLGDNGYDFVTIPNVTPAPIASLSLTVGDGGNFIKAVNVATGSITAGAGSDSIEVEGTAYVDSSISINAGDGNNTVVVAEVEDVTVTTGSGDDSITIIGGDVDFDSADDTQDDLSGENGDETLLVIDAGTGNNTITFGNDEATSNQAITAIDGSSITGENITLVIQSETDLSRADVSGVTAVWMGNGDALTLTVSQFIAMGGSASFNVIGESFNAKSTINLIVDQDTSLDALDIESLPRSIDLSFEIKDGVQLELTAQQLHERVISEGVSLYNDMNTDFQSGTVLITGAGTDFDPFNNNDAVRTDDADATYLGGSLSSDFHNDAVAAGGNGDGDITRDEWGSNVLVDRTLTGYDRPADTPSYSRLVIDTDSLEGGVLNPFDTIETFLRIVGDSGLTFEPVASGVDEWGRPVENAGDSIELATDSEYFLIDYSGVGGEVSGLVVEHFEKATVLVDGVWMGGVFGNGINARLDVKLEGDVGTDEQGLISSGVQTFVVVDADDDHTFYTCETTQDLEVLGIQGLYDTTITFDNTERGVEFLMEVEYAKDVGYAVGHLVGDFAREDADAVVNIVGLDALPAGEVQMVEGITLINAESATINITGGDTEIDAFTGADVSELTLTADADVEFPAISTVVDSFDASGVVGELTTSMDLAGEDDGMTFVGAAGGTTLTVDDAGVDAIDSISGAGEISLIIDGTVNLTAASLTNVTSVSIGSGDTLVLTIAQSAAIGEANIVGDSDMTSVLTLVGLGEEAFSLAAYDSSLTFAGLNLQVISADEVTLHPDTDLTDVASLVVPEGTVLNLTAAQFQQLNGTGTITGVDATGAASTEYTVNITDLTQADVAAGLDIALVTAENISITLAENVDIPADDAPDINTSLAVGAGDSLTINIGDDMTLVLPEAEDVDGATINGGSNSTLEFSDDTASDVDASGWDIDFLRVSSTYVAASNIDDLFQGLLERVEKVVFQGPDQVNAIPQTVTLEEGITITGGFTIARIEDDYEISDLTINMEGGVEIVGDLTIDSTDKNDGSDLLHSHLKTLVINSTGTAQNQLSGDSENIITGDITSDDGTVDEEADNNLLDVTINADQDFIVTGNIIFESVTGDDSFGFNDDDEAEAVLAINGAADVTFGIDTSDTDVDALTVTHNGTGTATINVAAANIDAADALAFQGTGSVVLIVSGTVDLSDDDLSAVTQIHLADGADLTLSQAQIDAIGAGNITIDDGDAADLNVVGVGSTPFDATAFDEDIDIQDITLVSGTVTLDPATNLTDVDSIIVPEGSVLNLTAAQFQQLLGAGTITGVDADGNASSDYTVNITDLMQADVDDLITTGITADTVTLALGEDVDLTVGDVITNVDEVFMTDGQSLGLATSDQADGLDITGGANTTVTFLFAEMAGTALAPVNEDDSIDVSGYSITTLRALAVFVGGVNAEFLLDDLSEDVTLNLFYDPDAIGVVVPYNRFVVVEESVTSAGIEFNDLDELSAVRNLTVTLQGEGDGEFDDDNGSTIDGTISGGDAINLGTIVTDPADTITTWFDTLTIVSEGDAADAPNQIIGNISPLDNGDADIVGPPLIEHADNDLLTVAINATHDLNIVGDIVFNYADAASGRNNADTDSDANVVLTITGDAPVSIGGYVGQDGDGDIDSVTITSTSTAEVTLGLDAASAVDANTSIDGGAGGIALTIDDTAAVDLSPATLAGINSLTIGDNASATATIDQLVNTIGLANITGGTNSTLNIGLYMGEEIDAQALADDAGVDIGTIVFAADAGDITVDANTDFTGVNSLEIPAGTTVFMTADQFAQLDGIGTITGDGTVHITDFNNTHGDTDFSGVDDDVQGTIFLDAAEAAVIMSIDGDLADLDVFAVELTANNQSVTFSGHSQADGRTVTTGDAITGTQVVIGYEAPTTQIVTTDYASTIDEVRVFNTLVADQNVEDLLFDLASAIDVTIFRADDDAPVDSTVIESTNRVVNVEENVTVDGDLIFNDLRVDTEVTTLTINLEGGADIQGTVNIPTVSDPIILDETDQFPAFFGELVINSDGDSPNSIENIAAGTEGGLGTAETFTVTFTADTSADGDGTITFDGVVITVPDGTSANDIRAAVVTAINDANDAGDTHWTAVAGAGAGEVDFTLDHPENVDDVVNADFVIAGSDTTATVAAVVDGASPSENNLLDVVINATQDLTIDEIEFSSRNDSDDEATATLEVNGAGNVVINDLDTDDDDVDALVVDHNGTGDLTIALSETILTVDAADAITVDGSDAAGNTIIAVHGDLNLSDDTLVGVNAIELTAVDADTTAAVTLTTTQFVNIGEAGFSLVDNTTGGVAGVQQINLTSYNGEDIQSDELNADPDDVEITIQSITVEDTNGTVTVPAGADLSNVQSIVIPEGTTLEMTADQFQSMPTGTITGDGTLNITNLDDDNADIDLSTVAANAGVISLDAAAATVVLNGVTDAAVLDGTGTVSAFSILMTADGQSLTLSNETQADGRTVDGSAQTNTTLVLGFDNADGTDADAIIESAGFDVDDLFVLDEFVDNATAGTFNFEEIYNGLSEDVTVTIFEVGGAVVVPVDATAISTTNRVVIVEPDTDVVPDIAFNILDGDAEVATLSITLSGNSNIQGSLLLPTNLDTDLDPLGDGTQFALYFRGLTINSEGTGANSMGDISAVGAGAQETFSLTLDAAMAVVGGDTVTFDGTTVDLTGAGDELGAAALIAAAEFENWTVANGGGGVLNFTSIVNGNVTDPVIGDFVFSDEDGASTNLTGVVGANVDGAAEENNLLDITINADTDVTIGTIFLQYQTNSLYDVDDNPIATQEATITVNGAADVTITQVDTTDIHVTGVNLVHNGTGTLTAPGASPGLDLGAGTTTVTFDGTGNFVFGSADDALTDPDDVDTLPDASGVNGAALTTIDASTLTGDLDLGTITDVDESDFTLTAGSGVTTVRLGDANNNAGAMNLDSQGDWTFDLSAAAAGSTLTLSDTVTIPDMTGEAAADAGSLTINTGANGVLVIDGNVDLRTLVDTDGNNKLDLTGVVEINIPAGSSLQLTDAQWAAFTGTITGDGADLLYIDDTNVAAFGGGAAIDLLDVRGVNEIQIDDQTTGLNTLTLTSTQALITSTVDTVSDPDVVGDAGDLDAFTTVNIDVDAAADISDVVGGATTTTIDVDAGVNAALTVRNTQMGALAAGDTNFDDDFEETSGLSIVAQIVTGFDFVSGDAIPGDQTITVTINTRDINNNITDYSVSGSAIAIANSSDQTITEFAAVSAADETAFDAMLAGASAIEHTGVGSEASIRDGDGVNTRALTATAGVEDTFVFIGTTGGVAASLDIDADEYVSITGFANADGDQLDISAMIAADGEGTAAITSVANNTGQTVDAANTNVYIFAQDASANDVDITTDDNNDIADFTDLADVAAWLDDGSDTDFLQSDTLNEVHYLVLNDGTDSYIYEITDANDGAAVTAGELNLVGMVNGVLVAADFTIA
ncbi:DUF4214 domain-containing protein [Pseudomaricurvus alkylphenolicus]|uniref:beta strand repeat-containing protein n=1 Tax=Pseudomaricurvus alkylphenolicus TaxID=1306991 RepID=UPI0014211A9D|nr:DUF4214 domain-containing protein [Pseudomaricurvus alkylphenolicus]NIB42084.1 DUF4214 domain-containing protein [Pseudomaricurvus alkylphenolicus]